MFDIFRDIILEAQGIDSNAAEKERMAKKEAKKELRKQQGHIVSKGVKAVMFLFGISYLIITAAGIILAKEAATLTIAYLIRSVLLVSCDVAALILMAIGKKKTEIAALILIGAFVVGEYFTLLLMI